MKTEFCIFCGNRENLEHHHVLPRVLGGGDEEENMLTCCNLCHDKIHTMGKCSNHKELQRIGIEKAKAAGKYKGRVKSLRPEQVEEVKTKVASGVPKSRVASEYGITRATLYKYL